MTASTVLLRGLPFDGKSSFMHGAAEAPGHIRETFYSEHSHLWTESDVDLGAPSAVEDLGDAVYPEGCDFLEVTEDAAAEAFAREGEAPLFLGGDHSLTWPVLRAAAFRWPNLTVLHFDAHPDLYDALDGDRESHACPFARVMEEGLASRLIQVGVRTLPPHLKAQVDRFGVECHLAADLHRDFPYDLQLAGPVYVSFDMDALDPSCAPGVSHHEPGGLTTRQALDVLHTAFAAGDAVLVGADVVELNPSRDVRGVTAQAAAKVAKELAGIMLGGRKR